MQADAATRAEVVSALKNMTQAYVDRDIDGFMACFVPDNDVILYGTGADEKRVGRAEVKAQAERDWAQTDAVELAFNEPAVSAAGPVAWVAMDGDFKGRMGSDSFSMPVRVSLVLENRGGDWLIAHSHFSTPMADQEEGSSF